MVVEEANPPPPPLPPANATTSLDEASTTARTQSFLKALQELKNLGPQLYSAADRTERSYHYGKQSWTVVERLRIYAKRAVVNAVDHLGNVASKLNQIVEEQTLGEISVVESKVDCLHQKLLTCKTYIDQEGVRQQLLLPDHHSHHHKHYTLPALAVGKKVDASSLQPSSEITCSQLQNKPTKPKLVLLGSPAPKTLSWHIATQAKSKLKRFVGDEEEGTRTKTSSSTRLRSLRPGPASFVAMQTLGIDSSEGYKPIIIAPNRQSFGEEEEEERAKLHVPITRSNNSSSIARSTLFVKHKIKQVIRTGA